MKEKDLIKEFEFFCKLSRGTFTIEVFPICKKLDYSISLEYSVGENKFNFVGIRIRTDKGDFEILRINDVTILDTFRDVEFDERGELSFYVFMIKTDKGNIKIKRSIREDKIIIEFENNDIRYSSSVLF